MRNVYAVRAVPVRNEQGAIVGWIRADVLTDGSRPSDIVFLRDGSASGQAQALKRIAENPALLYRSRAEAVREGIKRLRDASRA